MTDNLYTPDCISTVSGRYVNVFEPQSHMFHIDDIAHALARIPRFGGHLPVWYSVGMHCLNVMECVPQEHKLTALLHDASEAYLLDLPTPIKNRMPQYRELEDGLMAFLAKDFGFQWPLPQKVKEADRAMLQNEWRNYMLKKHGDDLSVLSSKKVTELFLRHYHRLTT